MACEKLLTKCHVSINDIKASHTIFGLDNAGLREKRVWEKPENVDESVVVIPQDLLSWNS